MSVYLDYAATAPLDSRVRDAFVDAMHVVGNPSSIHGHGQAARAVLEDARERVAAVLHCDSAEVVFTSGGTESINTALKGLYWQRQHDAVRPVVVAAEGEHHATVEAVDWLVKAGAEVVWLALDAEGSIHPDALQRTIDEAGPERVAFVSFIWANNEVGTIQPVRQLAHIAASAGIPVHVDAVAALGQVEIAFDELSLAALSISAHKIGGPVGVGALLLSRQWEVESLLHGGDQQRGRSGTMHVAGAVAFAKALELNEAEFVTHTTHLRALQSKLIEGIHSAVPDAVLRGAEPGPTRLPGNVHVTIPGCQGDSLLFLLDQRGFSVSTGSACHAGVSEISHVLIAMGIPETEAAGALRFTLGDATTPENIDALIAVLPEVVAIARQAGVNSAS
jgi:cysteine desulfurase